MVKICGFCIFIWIHVNTALLHKTDSLSPFSCWPARTLRSDIVMLFTIFNTAIFTEAGNIGSSVLRMDNDQTICVTYWNALDQEGAQPLTVITLLKQTKL